MKTTLSTGDMRTYLNLAPNLGDFMKKDIKEACYRKEARIALVNYLINTLGVLKGKTLIERAVSAEKRVAELEDKLNMMMAQMAGTTLSDTVNEQQGY
jgi:hypothetical protein